MTPELSYVSSNKQAISIAKLENELYVFWSGRKKVGKSWHTYGFPAEVFYVVMKI